MSSEIKTSKLCSAKKMARTTKYWTPSRMKSATPIPFPKATRDMLRRTRNGDGVTKIVQPVPPQQAERLAASTNKVGDMTVLPFSYVGKLFMREGSNDYVGSAWVIGKKAIFSAAHCLLDDNKTFFDDVVFRPQYKNGASLGVFAITQSSVDKRYAKFDDVHLNFDLGIGILDAPIAHLTGIAGYAINPISQIANGQKVTGIGYPAGQPFDGTKMFKSKGKVVRDSAPGTTIERFFGAENDMTGGCSGGPWVDGSNIAIGLNSFVFVDEDPPVMHSPYFGDGFENLIEWGRENGGIRTESDGDEGDNASGSFDRDVVRNELSNVIETLESMRNRIS